MPTDESAKLRMDLKKMLVKRLRLEGLAPETIGDETPFTEGQLGLDSIDLLELALAVEEAYGIKIDDDELGKAAFRSIASLADFIRGELEARSGEVPRA